MVEAHFPSAGTAQRAMDPTPRARLRRLIQSGAAVSTLSSLIVHMLLAIALGLLLFAVETVPRGATLDVTLQDPGGGGSSGGGDLAGESLLAVSRPDAPPADELAEAVAAPTELAERVVAALSHPDALLGPRAAGLSGLGAANLAADGGQGAGRGGGRGDGEGPGKGPGRATFFGVEARGRKIVYVCDYSGSMGYAHYSQEADNRFVQIPWTAARAELLYSINQLDKSQQFGIVFYNQKPLPFDPAELSASPGGGPSTRRVRPWETRVFAATNELKQLAAQFVADLSPEGETNHAAPLELAIRMAPDVIYLLTDGEEKDDLSPSQILWLTRLNRGRATINVIQFTQAPRSQNTMIDLAHRNAGRHIYVDIAAIP